MVWPFALAYFLSYALRNINAVVGPAMQAELGLSPGDLGGLSAAYFLVFAFMQLPLGALLDRFGPRRVEMVLLMFGAAGCATMALGDGLVDLWLGRALVGIGVSACLMGAYKAFRMQFAPEQQAGLASVMLVVGTVGAIAVTTPVAWLVEAVGWRMVFWLCALLFVLSSLSLGWLVPPLPGSARVGESLFQQSLRGIGLVMRHREFLRLAPFALVTYGGYLAMSGLWLGPWLREVVGMSAPAAAAGLAQLMVAALVGHLLVAVLAHRWAGSDVGRIDRLLHGGVLALLLLSAGAVAMPELSLALWALAFVAAGFTTLAYIRISLCFEPERSGQATTAINFVIFLGGFLVQWLVGLWPSLLEAFWGWVALQALAWLFMVGMARGRRRAH